jgi:hypothetical protein
MSKCWEDGPNFITTFCWKWKMNVWGKSELKAGKTSEILWSWRVEFEQGRWKLKLRKYW